MSWFCVLCWSLLCRGVVCCYVVVWLWCCLVWDYDEWVFGGVWCECWEWCCEWFLFFFWCCFCWGFGLGVCFWLIVWWCRDVCWFYLCCRFCRCLGVWCVFDFEFFVRSVCWWYCLVDWVVWWWLDVLDVDCRCVGCVWYCCDWFFFEGCSCWIFYWVRIFCFFLGGVL